MSILNIWAVARYEAKMLFRSWFFRIFAIITLVLINLFWIPIQLAERTPYFFRALSGTQPYVTFMLLNVIQTIMLIFMASDFLKRDRKQNSTEVIYARSMTNFEYIKGKVLGILAVFLTFNIVVAVAESLVQIIFADAGFVFLHYVRAFLFFSVPTLLFVLGLTLLVMSLLRNQAVTFLVLLGYAGTCLFYLQSRNFFFDFIGFGLPAGISDFIGIAASRPVILQRLGYALFGISFMAFTVIRMKRLPQSKIMNRLSLVMAVIFFILGGMSFGKGWQLIRTQHVVRQQQRDLNRQYVAEAVVTVLENDLGVIVGKPLAITADLKLKNETPAPLSKLLFSLNPGFELQSAVIDEDSLKFKREQQLVWINLSEPMVPGAEVQLKLCYGGGIDEDYVYLDALETEWKKPVEAFFMRFQKKYALVEKNYVLLTPASIWYPVAGIPYGANYPEIGRKNFTSFSVTARVPEGMTVISQGRKTVVDSIGGQTLNFVPETPLADISLVAGNYREFSVTVDSIDYRLYVRPGHEQFTEYYTELADTAAAIIRNSRNDLENYLGLDYPFQRLSLVETPIQFFGYSRPWTLSREYVQPEMIFLPEKGMFLSWADTRFAKWLNKRMADRRGQTLTDAEKQAQSFSSFINSNFSGLQPMAGMMGQNTDPAYRVLPQFFQLSNNFYSSQWPIINLVIETAIEDRIAELNQGRRRVWEGLSAEEKANLILENKSLAQVLADSSLAEEQLDVVRNKGAVLFAQLKYQIGEATFTEFLNNLLMENRFQAIPAEKLVASIDRKFKVDFQTVFENWYTNTALPGILVHRTAAEEIIVDERTRYQTRLELENPESVPAIIKLIFEKGGRRRLRFAQPPQDNTLAERLVLLPGGITKEIGVLLDEKPARVQINTMVAKNLPKMISVNFLEKLKQNRKARPFEGEREITRPVTSDKIEIIVDNEDSGFVALSQDRKSLLQKLFQKENAADEKYKGLNFWSPPGTWKLVANDRFYGKYVLSGYYIKSGNGGQKVAWIAQLPESGTYDVYVYGGTPFLPHYRGRRGSGRSPSVGQYHYTVFHDDGANTVDVDMKESGEEWVFLDSYYFSAGAAKVELSDRSDGQMVFADAVRFVKK